MIDNFVNGYTKCLLDMQSELRTAKGLTKSKTKQLVYITSLIECLLKNKKERDLYRDNGGMVYRSVNPKGEVEHVFGDRRKKK